MKIATQPVAARDVRLEDEGRLSATATRGGDGGEIEVRAGTLTLTGHARLDASTSIKETHGAGGAIAVQVGTLTLIGAPQISSGTRGVGRGGSITVRASEALVMRGSDQGPAVIASDNTSGSGDAGQVMVSAPTVHLDNGRIQAIVNEIGTGGGGQVAVQAGTLTLTNGARISASSFGAGQPGLVTVTATEAIRIADGGSEISGRNDNSSTGNATVVVTAPRVRLETGGQIRANAGATGKGGDIAVQTGTLTLTEGARINSSTPGAGPGGAVTVRASETILIVGLPSVRGDRGPSGVVATTAGQGQGGNITVQAPRVELTEGAMISAASTGPGNAGNVTLTLGNTFVSTKGSIVTRATQADGGNIQITAPRLVRLRDSTITTEVGGGATTVGGNITIDPPFVLLQNSQIVANAFAGKGGNIRIQAQQAFLADPASQLSASSALGINGQVAIQAPVTSISGAMAPLPQSFAQAAELLRSRCAERLREGTISRFVLGGRDGVPLEPGSLLQSPLQRMDQETGVQAGQRQPQHPEAQPAWGLSAQAHAREGWEGECARWMGQPGPSGSPKRRR